jgi:hypothetical protein
VPVRVHRLSRGRLASADLPGQGDDDARRAAQVAQQDALELCHLAEEFGATDVQPGTVSSMSSTANMTRCRPSVLGGGPTASAGRRRGVVPGQLQLAAAVRNPAHRDLAPHAVQPDGTVRPDAFDRPSAFQLHAELAEERDGGVQVVYDNSEIGHPLNGHVGQHRAGARPASRYATDSVTLGDAYDPGERALIRRYARS